MEHQLWGEVSKLKQYIPDKIYRRGKEYYENDLIDNVEHEFPDLYTKHRDELG